MDPESKSLMRRTATQRFWFTLTSLVSKDFKLKYRRSILGVGWSVLNPLLMMVVLTAVFSFIFRFDMNNYAVYLILGNTLFNYMVAASTSGMTSIINSASLIKKIRINKIVFPFEKVLFEFVNFAISLIAVVIVIVYFYFFPNESNPRIVLTANLAFLPLLLVYVSLFSAGLSLLLSSLAVFFRDVIHIWGVVTMAWMYATPLFYPFEVLSPAMQSAMQFNPMFHYVFYFRDILLWGITPSLAENLTCIGMAIITFCIGLAVFNRTQKKFILYV